MIKHLLSIVVIVSSTMAFSATANWTFSGVNIYDGMGADAVKISSGTAYLFQYVSGSVTQKSVYDSIVAGSSIDSIDGNVAHGEITSGNIASTPFSYGEQGSGAYSYFFAVLASDQKSVYLSATVEKVAGGTTTSVPVSFGSQAPTTGPSSKLMTDGYEAPGQWASINGGDVPEPTTCSLLLVGLAGMGLKRLRSRRRKQA